MQESSSNPLAAKSTVQIGQKKVVNLHRKEKFSLASSLIDQNPNKYLVWSSGSYGPAPVVMPTKVLLYFG